MLNNFKKNPHFQFIKKVSSAFVLACVILASFRNVQSEKIAVSADKVIQSLQGKARNIKYLRGNLELASSFTAGKEEPFKASGFFYAEAPNHFRMDMQTTLKDPERGMMKMKAEFLLDGKNLWIKVDNKDKDPYFLGMVDVAKLQQEFPKNFSKDSLSQNYTPWNELSELDLSHARLLGKMVLKKQEVFILEGALRKGFGAFFRMGSSAVKIPAHMRVWVGQKDGVSYQTMMFDDHEKKIGWIKLSHVTQNPSLDESLFQFVVPQGVTPIDLTPMMEEELTPSKDSSP